MKFFVNDKMVNELGPTQKKVLAHEIPAEMLEADLERRVVYIINHKYERSFQRLKEEWDPKLRASGVAMIPTDPDAYAELVFAQPDYKDRAAREAQAARDRQGE